MANVQVATDFMGIVRDVMANLDHQGSYITRIDFYLHRDYPLQISYFDAGGNFHKTRYNRRGHISWEE